MVSYLTPVWLNAFLASSLFGYLFLLWRVSSRLRAAHGETWRGMGEPFSAPLKPNSIASTSNLGFYVFLTGRHRSEGDPVLSRLVYAARALFVLAMLAVLLASTIGHQAKFAT